MEGESGVILMGFIKRFLCSIFGHKRSHIKLAYSISVYSTYFRVEIYEVSICPRCDFVSVDCIDRYEKYNWFSTRLAKAEENELRKQELVTLAEAYKELRV